MGAIATLAARARIRELEESESWLATRGSQQRERRQSAVRQRIIDLSVRYGLLSRETSFVAIEHRATPLLGDMQLRRVPVALAHGWGGRESVPAMRARWHAPASPALDGVASAQNGERDDRSTTIRCQRRASDASLPDIGASPLSAPTQSDWANAGARLPGDRGAQDDASRIASRARLATPASPRSAGRPAGLDALVKLQSAAGAWELDDALAQVIGHSVDDLRLAIPDATVAREALARAWATAVAIAWLERHAAAQVGEWRVLAIKARQWLDGEFAGTPRDAAAWLAAARSWLASPIPF